MADKLNLTTLLSNVLLSERTESDQEYYGTTGAGVLVYSKKTKRFLLGLRSSEVAEPGTWGVFGGSVKKNETSRIAAKRELQEETGYKGPIAFHFLYLFEDGEFSFHNYLGVVDDEFEPHEHWEHDNYVWVEYGNWPEPLHFGTQALLRHAHADIEHIIIAHYSGLDEATVDLPPVVRHEPAPDHGGVATPKKLQDAYVVVATLWGEARGEGDVGMQAVLNVIMNRAKNNFNGAVGVALKPKQFSVWNGINDPYQYANNLAAKARANKLKDADLKSYRQAIILVDKAMKGQLPDITGGATFYFNPKLANPSWAKKLKFLKRIGNHDFYGTLPARKKP